MGFKRQKRKNALFLGVFSRCEPQRDTDRTDVARKKKILKILKAIDETEMLELPPFAKKKKSSKAHEQMKKINNKKRKEL